jgi:hypothetical protein
MAATVQIAGLEPATHAYSFWEGVPRSGKQAFGSLFQEARTMKVCALPHSAGMAAAPAAAGCLADHACARALQAVAVVQRAIRGRSPESEMAELGFGQLLLIKSFSVSMSGETPLTGQQ